MMCHEYKWYNNGPLTFALSIAMLSLTSICCSPDPRPDKGSYRAKENKHEEPKPPETQEWKDFQKVVESNSEFAFSFYKTLPYQSDNVIYSPFSIYVGLAAITAGAEGTTHNELKLKMNFPEEKILYHQLKLQLQYLAGQSKSQSIKIHNATRAWANTDLKIKPEYKGILQDYFTGSLGSVSFQADPVAASGKINRWVEWKTAGKMKDIVSPRDITKRTRLMLVNVMYFKGLWAERFSAAMTKPDEFHLDACSSIEVPMMNRKAHYEYYDSTDAEVLRMRYGGKELAMVIAVPKPGTSIRDLEQRLTPEKFRTWTQDMDANTIDVFIPRFKLNATVPVQDTLESMGISEIFKPSANFSRLCDGCDKLFGLESASQKTILEVDEYGTVAVSTTKFGSFGLDGPKKEFRADKPFLFFIQGVKSGLILFMGKIVNPKPTAKIAGSACVPITN
ncbi:MAG: serpin family protein [Proteobacteria bacterium]|nr:serpin family protein [Pseudomonadota bacterium]